jgi:tetratricopeptide (TPR) repeat protein
VKRTVPKHILPKKTAAEYEAEGDGFYEQKDYDSALVAYENAAKLKASYRSLYRTGWIYNDFSEYANALPALERALAIDGTQSAAYTEKGYALRRLGRTDEAIAAFNRSISINSEEYVAPFELGSIYEEKKNYAEAERYLNQSIKNKPDKADAYTELGIVQRHLGRNADAVRSLDRAIELDPENGRAYMGLGDVYYYGTSEYQKAIDSYIKGLQYDPDNAVAAFNVGYSYNDIGNYGEALQYLAKAAKANPGDFDTYVETGYAYRKQKVEAQAMTSYQKALQLKPNGATALFGIGDVYFEIEKKYDLAAGYYRRGLATDPDSPSALYRLGYSYNDAGKYSEAVDVLERAHNLKPQWLNIMDELGYSYLQLKRLDDAATILRQAISANRDAELAHYYLGQVYVSRGNRNGANNEYRELQRLNSQYTEKLMDMIRKM